jgi:hypothetical protein
MSNHQVGLIGLHWLYDPMNFSFKDIKNGKFCNKLIHTTYVNMCMKEIKVQNTFLQKCKLVNCFRLQTQPNPLNFTMF